MTLYNKTIVAGGTAQTVPESVSKNYRYMLAIKNTSSGDLSVAHDGAVASKVNGELIHPGMTRSWALGEVPQGAVSVWGATTGQSFTIQIVEETDGLITISKDSQTLIDGHHNIVVPSYVNIGR